MLPPEESAVANRGASCGPTRGVLCREQRSGASCVLPTEESAVPRKEERSLLCAANEGECCVANRQCGGPQQEFGRFDRKSIRFRRELGRSGREFGSSRPAGLAGLPPQYHTQIIPPTYIVIVILLSLLLSLILVLRSQACLGWHVLSHPGS